VTSVYRNYAPFRRWLRWKPDHPEIEAEAVIREINSSLEAEKREDDMKGATGEWVGLMGFSQGAKVCASILLQQQALTQRFGWNGSDTHYRFGILLTGRGPLISFDSRISSPGLVSAADLGVPGQLGVNFTCAPLLEIPTIHVHGLRDPGLELHRQLLRESCEGWSARVVEWDGDHRVPVKTKYVGAVANSILNVAMEIGIVGSVC